jgi:hypothetical protein
MFESDVATIDDFLKKGTKNSMLIQEIRTKTIELEDSPIEKQF